MSMTERASDVADELTDWLRCRVEVGPEVDRDLGAVLGRLAEATGEDASDILALNTFAALTFTTLLRTPPEQQSDRDELAETIIKYLSGSIAIAEKMSGRKAGEFLLDENWPKGWA